MLKEENIASVNCVFPNPNYFFSSDIFVKPSDFTLGEFNQDVLGQYI